MTEFSVYIFKKEAVMGEGFGTLMRRTRESSKKTLKELAEYIGVSVVYVSDIERGRRNPPDEGKLHKIAEFLKLDIEKIKNLADLDRNRVELDINEKDSTVSQAALMLARRWDNISESEAQQILQIFNKEKPDE